jgi:hypothetical protein
VGRGGGDPTVQFMNEYYSINIRGLLIVKIN